MRKIDNVKEIQIITLSILQYYDKVCRENCLNYFLAGGSLLGAIRHNGYIPWDDDIDIYMPRKDFLKLIKILEENDSRYVLFYPGGSEDYYYTYGKLVDTSTVLEETEYSQIKGLGVNIDIFPLDGLPSDEDQKNNHFNKVEKLRRKINRFAIPKPVHSGEIIKYIWRLLRYTVYHAGSLVYLQKKLLRLSYKYDYYESDFAFPNGGAYGTNDIMESTVFGAGIEHSFEEIMVKIPERYDVNLTQLYGNYMELPPEEKRISHHSFNAWYR